MFEPILRDKLLVLGADKLGAILCDDVIRYPEPCKLCFRELYYCFCECIG